VEDNGSAGTANAYVDPFIAQISPAGDNDFVAVNANAGDTITAQVTNVPGATGCEDLVTDSEVDILDTDGTTSLAFNDDDAATFCSLATAVAPSSGTFFVRAASSSFFAPDDEFAYQLVVTVAP
jgi:hypothetical protein